jgi:hypothetical protein
MGGITIGFVQHTAAVLDDRHLVVIGVVAVIAYLASCGRRPQRQCPRCKEINRAHAAFCSQCGTRLPGK